MLIVVLADYIGKHCGCAGILSHKCAQRFPRRERKALRQHQNPCGRDTVQCGENSSDSSSCADSSSCSLDSSSAQPDEFFRFFLLRGNIGPGRRTSSSSAGERRKLSPRTGSARYVARADTSTRATTPTAQGESERTESWRVTSRKRKHSSENLLISQTVATPPPTV